MSSFSTLRAAAAFEALKGLAVLVAGTGLLSFVHKDLYAAAVALVAHAHLNPASRYPQIFLDAALRINDGKLLLLAAGAALYSVVRLVEAYGLFHARPWAEWFAAVSGAVYVPFEVYECVRKPTWLAFAFLVLNLAVVGIMVLALVRRHRSDTP
jgi:uncharacterized membrane protein (DUF2068 family)